MAAPLVALLLVTGCTEADSDETNLDYLPASDLNRQDRAALVPGGELRLAVDDMATLNPIAAESSPELARLQQAYLPTFFRYDESGVAAPNTNFLESATETSTNPTQVTLKLNPSAVWGDGARITAEDVIATWTACNGQTAAFRCAPDLGFNEITDMTQGASDSEVQISFAKAYPQWRSIFDRVSVLRAASVADPEVFNTGWETLPKEWTAGPFLVEEDNPEDEAIVATPNPEWWGPDAPLLQRLTIKEIPADEQVEAYANAEIDALTLPGSNEAFTAARNVPETSIRRAGDTAWRELVFNTTARSPVNEHPVRQAIAIALDRSGVGTAAMAGNEFIAAPQGNRIFLPQQEGYADNADSEDFTRDLREARNLLDDAGWREADAVRSRDGQPLEVRLAHVQGDPVSENEARTITEQLARVGVTVTTSSVSPASYANGSALAGGDFDLIVITGQGSRHPLETIEARFGSGAEENYARFDSPEADALIEQILAAPDAPARQDLANDLDALLWQSMPTVPLYQLPQDVAVSARMANFGAPGLSSIAWEQIGFIQG